MYLQPYSDREVGKKLPVLTLNIYDVRRSRFLFMTCGVSMATIFREAVLPKILIFLSLAFFF